MGCGSALKGGSFHYRKQSSACWSLGARGTSQLQWDRKRAFVGSWNFLDLDTATWLYVSVCQNSCNCIQGDSDMSVSKVKLKNK